MLYKLLNSCRTQAIHRNISSYDTSDVLAIALHKSVEEDFLLQEHSVPYDRAKISN